MGPWQAALRDVLPTRPGVAEPAAALAEIPPTMRGEAVLRLMRALAGSTALLIGLEDLHWADPDTLAVVEYLADNLQAERVLCVVTVRSEPGSPAYELVQALNARRNIRLLVLPRLSKAETGRMEQVPPAAHPPPLRNSAMSCGPPMACPSSSRSYWLPRERPSPSRPRWPRGWQDSTRRSAG